MPYLLLATVTLGPGSKIGSVLIVAFCLFYLSVAAIGMHLLREHAIPTSENCRMFRVSFLSKPLSSCKTLVEYVLASINEADLIETRADSNPGE